MTKPDTQPAVTPGVNSSLEGVIKRLTDYAGGTPEALRAAILVASLAQKTLSKLDQSKK